jgi:hypothetical protein
MSRELTMQANKVATIEGENGTIICDSKFQHLVVGKGLIRLACFLNRQHIVPECTQLLDDRKRKVFVGIKPRHQSASFSSIWRVISSR